MLWDVYLSSFKKEITKVKFLSDYVYEIDGHVFRFNKDLHYHLPKTLAKELKQNGTIELVEG